MSELFSAIPAETTNVVAPSENPTTTTEPKVGAMSDDEYVPLFCRGIDVGYYNAGFADLNTATGKICFVDVIDCMPKKPDGKRIPIPKPDTGNAHFIQMFKHQWFSGNLPTHVHDMDRFIRFYMEGQRISSDECRAIEAILSFYYAPLLKSLEPNHVKAKWGIRNDKSPKLKTQEIARKFMDETALKLFDALPANKREHAADAAIMAMTGWTEESQLFHDYVKKRHEANERFLAKKKPAK